MLKRPCATHNGNKAFVITLAMLQLISRIVNNIDLTYIQLGCLNNNARKQGSMLYFDYINMKMQELILPLAIEFLEIIFPQFQSKGAKSFFLDSISQTRSNCPKL